MTNFKSLTALAAGLTVGATGPAAHAAASACLALPVDKVGLQTYAVFDAVRGGPPPPRAPGAPFPPPTATAAQAKALFADLKAIGYRRFENFGATLQLPEADYVAIVKASGLQAVSSHDSLELDGWNAVLDRAKALGQPYVGSGGFGKPGLDTLEHVEQVAANLNVLGEAAAKRGLKFFVHSHVEELARHYPYDLAGNGKPEPVSAWEIIAARTDPRWVSFEVDVGWAYRAFGPDHFEDLLRFLRKHRDRIPMLHIKDVAADGKSADMGLGAIDYKRVVEAAGPQIRYYLWEYDQPPQPMASAKIAFDYMTCARR